jgi:hypothetical protein
MVTGNKASKVHLARLRERSTRVARRVREPTQPGIAGSTLTRVAIAPRPLPQVGEVYSPMLCLQSV